MRRYVAIMNLLRLSPQFAQATLRYRYEQQIKHQRTRSWRQQHPYRAFRVCNLLIQRAAMSAHPFDEAIQRYGYEDLLLAKEAPDSISHYTPHRQSGFIRPFR